MAKNIWACASCARTAIHIMSHDPVALPLSRTITSKNPLTLSTLSRRSYVTASEFASYTENDSPRALQLPADNEDSEMAVAERKAQQKMRRNIKLSEQYLEDPWHLGQHIDGILKKDRFEEAYKMVQNFSKGKQVVVSWNHLIGYLLEKGKPEKAVKVYNDMKKRAQLPNVQTYTILFRGLAGSQHPKIAVAQATKHYNILMGDKRLKPNSTHLNAVLNVCARAGDIDSMFLIANTINEGERAPDAFTYTIIINALRHAVSKENGELPEDLQQANTLKTIDRAKGLWKEVVQKWHAGKLVIDEELVCAMGRIILSSPKKEDRKEIFDLLAQTMNIPNLTSQGDAEPHKDTAMHNIAVSQSRVMAPSSKGLYAIPGRNTLSLVLNLLASNRELTAGIKYWNLMVRHYGIIPDNDIWLRLLGMLKVSRSSAHAASMVEMVPEEYLEARHYRIAMETCLRDGLNQNVTKNANQILDSMLTRFYIPDIHAMRQYLEVILNSHAKFRAKSASGAAEEAKRGYGLQITSALARLWEPYKKVHYNYFKSSKPSGEKEEARLYNMQREVIALARHMVSAFNKVINENMVKEADLKEMRPVAAKMNREIQGFFHNRERREPNLRHGGASESQDSTGVSYAPPSLGLKEALQRKDARSGGLEVQEGEGEGASRRSRKDRNFTTTSEYDIMPAKPWVTYDRPERTGRKVRRTDAPRESYQRNERW